MSKNSLKIKVSNYSKIIVSILGISLVALMFAIICYWEIYGRNRFLYTSITVLNKEVMQGAIITDSMITTSRQEQSTLIKDPIINKDDIVGKEAKHYIPAYSPLNIKYFDNAALALGKDSFIVKLPNEWILSVPDSLRRTDKIVLYEVKATSIKNGVSTGSATVNTYSQDQTGSLKSQVGNSIVKTSVAYVKDSNNKEIIDVGLNDRFDGSSKIGSTEVILTTQQLDDLQRSYSSGNVFVIMYGN